MARFFVRNLAHPVDPVHPYGVPFESGPGTQPSVVLSQYLNTNPEEVAFGAEFLVTPEGGIVFLRITSATPVVTAQDISTAPV